MNEREIRRLIRIVEESGIGEIEVRRWWGAKRIRISKYGGAVTAVPAVPGPVTAGSVAPSSSSAPASSVSKESAPVSPAAPEVEERHTVIRSPIVGTFYRAPAPDAPPYVEVGDVIKSGQTVCIVEAMKLMNEIQAEQGGKVVRVLVENAQPVEYNEMLIVIDPEG
jgi:acetyl-CoA carboxylase biotin carboxyl carrier protein